MMSTRIGLLAAIVMVLLTATCRSQDSLRLIAAMTGEQSGDQFSVVAYAGDVNGDGYDDVLVGAPQGDYAKLFFGGAPFDTTRYVRFGPEQGGLFGFSVAGGGDVNGDGYPDIVIGAPQWWKGGIPYGITHAGRVYVYYGGPQMDTIPDLTMSPGSWYFEVGYSVAIPGDVNHDGYDDILVGSPMDDIDGRGRAYLFLGGAAMDTIPDAVMPGAESRDAMGFSVSGAGDVNRDGFDDFLVGAPQLGSTQVVGKAYLFYGGNNVQSLQSRMFVGDSAKHGQFGRMVARLGDLNGDGFADFGIMGLYKTAVYVGSTSLDSVPKMILKPTRDYWCIAGVDDMNQDDFDDIATVSEELRICLGSAVLDTIPDLGLPFFANPVCRLGDINGDHHPDMAVGRGAALTPNGQVLIYSYGVTDPVGEDADKRLPTHFTLVQNYPNPFNGQTRITIELQRAGEVALEVVNILGEVKAVLLDRWVEAGGYSVQFDASNLPSGVYIYRLTTREGHAERAMILLR